MIPRYDVLFDDDPGDFTGPLLEAYGGPLNVRGDRPRLITNFVSTVDGVVSLDGARNVSMGAPSDRFLMGLLRASADVVLIGAGTLRADKGHQWTPWSPFPESREQLVEFRRQLVGTAHAPTLVIASASGNVPGGHAALVCPEMPTIIVTTEEGATRLPRLDHSVRVVTAGPFGRLTAGHLLDEINKETRADLILSEAGPTLFAQLLRDRRVDELYLTVAPHLAGRGGNADRPGLVMGHAFEIGATQPLRLRSARRNENFLFLRYGL